ncbi:MAG: hypothetical protein V4819_19915 [Verrucomicrobiota bacterium]
MSLDLPHLEKPRFQSGKIIARCPACAETGADTGANHLFINADGKFGWVLYQSTDGADHRKSIFELAGIADDKPTQAGDKPIWTALSSAAASAPFPPLNHHKHGAPSAHCTFRTASGATAGIVDLAEGKNETLPRAWCRPRRIKRPRAVLVILP